MTSSARSRLKKRTSSGAAVLRMSGAADLQWSLRLSKYCAAFFDLSSILLGLLSS